MQIFGIYETNIVKKRGVYVFLVVVVWSGGVGSFQKFPGKLKLSPKMTLSTRGSGPNFY